jgi:putative phosphoribosyl transferase
MRFRDRTEAGQELAEQVSSRLKGLLPDRTAEPEAWRGLQVLALPRGGVPVGRPIADRLGARLRVLLVRKLGVPGHEELAMGAIAAIGEELRTVRNRDVLRQIRVSDDSWQRVWNAEAEELRRRTEPFGPWTAEPPHGPVVLVDDGMATGATMQAAVAAVRSATTAEEGQEQRLLIMVAVPVSAHAAAAALSDADTTVVCLSRPTPLLAIGESYRDFHQLSDNEVIEILSGSP